METEKLKEELSNLETEDLEDVVSYGNSLLDARETDEKNYAQS